MTLASDVLRVTSNGTPNIPSIGARSTVSFLKKSATATTFVAVGPIDGHSHSKEVCQRLHPRARFPCVDPKREARNIIDGMDELADRELGPQIEIHREGVGCA
jgi:hypothetical protein